MSALIDAVCSVFTQDGNGVELVVAVVVVLEMAGTVAGAATVGATAPELTAENMP